MMKNNLSLKDACKVHKAMSDPSRSRVLNMLFHIGEMCISDIEEILEFTQTKTSRHLIYLKNIGITANRKMEQWSFYYIRKDQMDLIGGFLEVCKNDEQLLKDLQVYKTMYSNRELAINKIEKRKYTGE